jgi:hypothetical protein
MMTYRTRGPSGGNTETSVTDSKSTWLHTLLLKSNLVSWSSRKHSTPSVSSCEAGYVSLFEAGRDDVWIRSLLCELGLFPGSIPTQNMHYNQGSIAWAEGVLRKVKHVELKYHHSQYLISTGQIKISYVASALNAACSAKNSSNAISVD